VIWTNNAPGDRVLHGQWSSTALAEVNGKTLVIAGMGDAWVRAFDAKTGKIEWVFDANSKDTVYPTTKNEIIATPVIVGTRMYLAVGQDPEHGEGPGHFWCIDITKQGDISKEIVDAATAKLSGYDALEFAMSAHKGKPNPNSGVIWDYVAKAGVAKPKSGERMNRSMSTVAVLNGLVFSADLSGYFHCFDADTGELYWTKDMESAMWGSPMAIDGKIFLTSEQGDVKVFASTKKLEILAELTAKEKAEDGSFESATLYCTPTYTNGTLFLMSRDKLFAISDKK
jgi:outer membrane protein assembly factor BamB